MNKALSGAALLDIDPPPRWIIIYPNEKVRFMGPRFKGQLYKNRLAMCGGFWLNQIVRLSGLGEFGMSHDAAISHYHNGAWLFKRIPDDVFKTLTDEQRTAIDEAARGSGLRRHPVNIRLSIPFFSKHFYTIVVAGEEKRGYERRKIDRQHHPMHTLGNIFFGLGILSVLYMALVFGVFFYNSLIEF
jgi:hypothetical protein